MRKITIIGVICIVVSLGLGIFLLITNNFKEYEIEEKYSFSETVNIFFTLTNEEKEQINQSLQQKFIENDYSIGFKSDSAGTDLYFVNSLVEISKTFAVQKTLTMLKEKTHVLINADLKSMNILNILYYVNMCETLGIDYSQYEIINCLEVFYDSKDKLFFLNENDSINVKIIVTALCGRAIPDILTSDKFDVVTGIQNAYSDYKFSTDPNITLYNSGGDILYCYSELGLINDSILTGHNDWFEYWKNQYESMTVNSIETALAYSEYYNIAVIFDENYSNEKIQIFYDSLSKNDLPDDMDFFMLNNALKNATHTNEDFNEYLMNKVNEITLSESLFKTDIDILATVYGVCLAKNTGFEIPQQKLQNYIVQNYNKIDKMEGTIDIINNLYYTIILDQLNNDYKISCESGYIQKIIDKALNSLDFKDDIQNDVTIARKALEIVMDLQLHNVNVHINIGQINKMKNGLERAVENKEVLNSVLITDLFILDNIMNTGHLNDDLFSMVYNSLTVNGGSRAVPNEEYPTDIYVTYRFFVCFDRMNNYINLPEQKKYAESLTDGYTQFESILHGKSIVKTTIGGDK